jgi:hypothetical protein
MAVKGTFKDISFIELIQLMHMSRKTGRVEVTHENRWAMVIFREGVLWHVEPRGFRGASPEEVLYAIIGMTEGNFVFQRVQVLPALERSINLSTENIIMEGTKRLDEEIVVAAADGGETRVSSREVLQVKPGTEAKVRYVPQAVKRVLQAINGHRCLDEVVQEAQLDPAQSQQIIKDLITQGVVLTVEVKQTEGDANAEEDATAQAAAPTAG